MREAGPCHWERQRHRTSLHLQIHGRGTFVAFPMTGSTPSSRCTSSYSSLAGISCRYIRTHVHRRVGLLYWCLFRDTIEAPIKAQMIYVPACFIRTKQSRGFYPPCRSTPCQLLVGLVSLSQSLSARPRCTLAHERHLAACQIHTRRAGNNTERGA